MCRVRVKARDWVLRKEENAVVKTPRLSVVSHGLIVKVRVGETGEELMIE